MSAKVILIVSFFLLFIVIKPNIVYACGECTTQTYCGGPYDCNYRQIEHTTCSSTVCVEVNEETWKCSKWETQTYSCLWYEDKWDTCCTWENCGPANEGAACGNNGTCNSGSCNEPPAQAEVIRCENVSNCPAETPHVVCAGSSTCSSGTSCWCVEDTENPGTGAGNCSEPAPGAAPCGVGLCGSWYCNSGQWQSYCQTCGGSEPPPAPIPAAVPDGAPISCGILTDQQASFETGQDFRSWSPDGSPAVSFNRIAAPVKNGTKSLEISNTQNGASYISNYTPITVGTYPSSSQMAHLKGFYNITSNPSGKTLQVCAQHWRDWWWGSWLGEDCTDLDATAGAGWKSFDFTNPYKAGANQLLIDFKVRGNGTLTWFLDQLCTTFENNPIPNCTNLTGPASLCVNSAGTYSADFSSAAGNLSGEINAGQNGTFLWYPSSQAISGTSGNRSFTWTPNTSGTYDLFCRAWNDSIAECRGKAAYIDGPPRYLCSGPTSSLTVTVNPAVAGEWTGYGACSAVEGPGTKTRTCTNPAPSCGGASCVGSATSNCCVASYPDIPSLSTPINNSTIGSSSVALDWNDVTDWGFGTADNITCTNANQYNVYLDTGLNPTTLKCTTNSTTTNCPVTGLTAGTYYWKVTATNGTLSTTSAVRKLVVQPFSAPTISYLSNTDNSITWQWNNPNSPNADYVWFQLSTSNAVNSGGSYPGSFQTTVSPSGGIYGITNTHIDYPTLTNTNTNLTCDVDYYAHVRAESDNPDFSPSSWSNIATFKIPATEPEKPTINSPGINTAPPPASVPILGNLNVAFDWDEPTDWGLGCPTNNNTYKLYAGTDRVLVTNGDASTLIASNLTSPAYTYSVPGSFDGQQIYWMVEASNGSEKAPSAVWTFWIKQPKICGPSLDSILYEDADRDVCYKSGTEPQINNAAITVLANGQTCSRPTAATFCCTIPGNNNGSSTVVNLTASGYEPYTGTTGCSTGTFPACSDNNCTFTLDPGDNVTANIGFEVKPWFQADSGSVYTAGYIASLIPGTPKHYDSGADIDKYFILNQAGPLMTGNNSAPNFGTGTASSPNWWDRNYSLDMNKFNYNFFQTKLANKITQNITGNAVLNNGILTANSTEYPITNNTLWNITGTLEADNATNLDGINAAFLVSGNITIKGNITPAPNISSLAFISGGNINIDPSVVEIRGLYLATGNFNDGLNNSQGLKIKGNAAALNQIILQRDWGTGYKPAEFFVSDPALYINLAQIFGLPSYTWSEVAP